MDKETNKEYHKIEVLPINKYKVSIFITIFLVVLVGFLGLAAGIYHGHRDGVDAIPDLLKSIAVETRTNMLSDVKMINDKQMVQMIMLTQSKLDKFVAEAIVKEVKSNAAAHELDPILVLSVITAESCFDPRAESNKQAVGLMQVHWDTWKGSDILTSLGISDKDTLFWIDRNIAAGTAILAHYVEEAENNVPKALYRYLSGKDALPGGSKSTDIDYLNKIMHAYYRISSGITRLGAKEISDLHEKAFGRVVCTTEYILSII